MLMEPLKHFDEGIEFYGTIDGWPCVRVKNGIVQTWMLGLGWHWSDYVEGQTILGENFDPCSKEDVEKLIAKEE